MRIAILVFLLAACSNDSDNKKVDAAVVIVDSKIVDAPKPIDAAVDAPPDGPKMNIVTACTHACNAIAACFMMPPEPDCQMGCEEDLADCTDPQIATIDACSTEMCGDIQNGMSPLIDCITAVSCVQMATGGSQLTDWRR